MSSYKYFTKQELAAKDAVIFDQQGAITLSSGTAITEFSTDVFFLSDSDSKVPTEKAIKSYIQTTTSSGIDTSNFVERLPEGLIYKYLDPTGSDSNDGDTTGTAWKTVQKAFDWYAKFYAPEGTAVAFVLSAGTFNVTSTIHVSTDFSKFYMWGAGDSQTIIKTSAGGSFLNISDGAVFNKLNELTVDGDGMYDFGTFLYIDNTSAATNISCNVKNFRYGINCTNKSYVKMNGDFETCIDCFTITGGSYLDAVSTVFTNCMNMIAIRDGSYANAGGWSVLGTQTEAVLYVQSGSNIEARNMTVANCNQAVITVQGSSYANVQDLVVTSCSNSILYVVDSSTVYASNASGTTTDGSCKVLSAYHNSYIYASIADFTGGRTSIYAGTGSYIHAVQTTCSGVSDYCFWADNNSKIIAVDAITSDASTAMYATTGSFINAESFRVTSDCDTYFDPEETIGDVPQFGNVGSWIYYPDGA